jgi:hypothetical protein
MMASSKIKFQQILKMKNMKCNMTGNVPGTRLQLDLSGGRCRGEGGRGGRRNFFFRRHGRRGRRHAGRHAQAARHRR